MPMPFHHHEAYLNLGTFLINVAIDNLNAGIGSTVQWPAWVLLVVWRGFREASLYVQDS